MASLALPDAPDTPAQDFSPQLRQQIALLVLTRQATRAQLARHFHTSRKFIAAQARRARTALDQAFAPRPQPPDDRVLFYLPVTKQWLYQLVLVLIFVGRTSYRGVTEVVLTLFDTHLSLGTIRNLLRRTAARVDDSHRQERLDAVRVGGHDEIYQDGPVLVGVDAPTGYCYLLAQEEHRDAKTWAGHLKKLVQRGYHPRAAIGDWGTGLRAGHAQALPDVPLRGDLFHALYELGPLTHPVESQAYEAIEAVDALRREQADYQWRHGKASRPLAQRIRFARLAEGRAITVADDVTTLLRWLREDVLGVAGPDVATRRQLYDWVTEQLLARLPLGEAQRAATRKQLAGRREDLLAFAVALEGDLAALAGQWGLSLAVVREVLAVQALGARDPQRQSRESALGLLVGERYPALRAAVAEARRLAVRASSVVESFNSRLRTYFHLRRQLGEDYLPLLRFFLNHHVLPRSRHARRAGHSAAELLTGQKQAHWLEQLGYRLFVKEGKKAA
jgi:hypothetical protein